MNPIVSQALAILGNDIEVEREDVAAELAHSIVFLKSFDAKCPDAIADGVAAAVYACGQDTFAVAVATLQSRVADEIAIEAKKIAMEMLLEVAKPGSEALPF